MGHKRTVIEFLLLALTICGYSLPLVEILTHISDARLQFAYMTNLSSAMRTDTALYGTTGFICPQSANGELTGNKNQWADLTEYPAAEFGNFFPGYCQAILNEEIDAAALQTCGPEEVCLCPRLPNGQPWRFLGWAGREVCALRVCLTFENIPCGEIALDSIVALENYRAQQLDTAAARQDAVDVPQADITAGISTGASDAFSRLLFQFDVAR